MIQLQTVTHVAAGQAGCYRRLLAPRQQVRWRAGKGLSGERASHGRVFAEHVTIVSFDERKAGSWAETP